MPSFLNMEPPPSSDEVQREAKGHNNSLDYLIKSLNTEEVEEPRVGWTLDTSSGSATATMSTGRSKGIQISFPHFYSSPLLISFFTMAWGIVFLTARVTFSQVPLTTRSSNRKKNEGFSTNSGLLLPNIPVNKDHRTLLDTLAELACEKGGMHHTNSLEDSSMTTVEGASPCRMVRQHFLFLL